MKFNETNEIIFFLLLDLIADNSLSVCIIQSDLVSSDDAE